MCPIIPCVSELSLSTLYARAQEAAREEPEALAYGQYESLGCLHQYRLPFELTRKYIPVPSEVLDWGCGGGHYSFTLLNLGHKVTAYTLWPEKGFLPLLANNQNFTLKIGTTDEPKKIPFENESFDSVISMGVLEHVRETGGEELASMKEIHRILRPGGLFLCAHFPNKRSGIEWVSRMKPKKPGQFTAHEFLYSKADIKNLCAEAGFELLETHLYNVLPRRVLNRIPGRNSKFVVGAYDALDWLLWLPFHFFAQNWVFVARKR